LSGANTKRTAEVRKFDEYSKIQRNDEKARLDNYGIELQNDPTSTATWWYIREGTADRAKSSSAPHE